MLFKRNQEKRNNNQSMDGKVYFQKAKTDGKKFQKNGRRIIKVFLVNFLMLWAFVIKVFKEEINRKNDLI